MYNEHKVKKYIQNPIFLNTASQVLARLFSSGSSFIVTLLITYYLGFESFGSFTKITAFVTFFYLFIDFGFNPIFLQKHFENAEKFLDKLLAVRFFISSLLLFIIVFISILLPYDVSAQSGFSNTEKLGIFLYSLTLFTHSATLTIQSIFQKKLAYKNGIFPTLLSSLVLLIGVGVGIFYKNIYVILLSYFVSGLTYTFVAMYITKSIHFHFKNSNFVTFSKELITSSTPLALILIFNVVYFRADTILLSFMKSTTDVGVYGFSYKFFEFAIIIPTYISNVLYPLLLKLRSDEKKLNIIALVYTKRMMLLGVVATVLAFVTSPLLIFIKDSYSPSVLPLQILILSLPFFFATSILQWVMVTKNQIKYLIIVYAITMGINVIANVLFIPQYSYIASAYITVITEGIIFTALMIKLQFDNAKIT